MGSKVTIFVAILPVLGLHWSVVATDDLGPLHRLANCGELVKQTNQLQSATADLSLSGRIVQNEQLALKRLIRQFDNEFNLKGGIQILSGRLTELAGRLFYSKQGRRVLGAEVGNDLLLIVLPANGEVLSFEELSARWFEARIFPQSDGVPVEIIWARKWGQGYQSPQDMDSIGLAMMTRVVNSMNQVMAEIPGAAHKVKSTLTDVTTFVSLDEGSDYVVSRQRFRVLRSRDNSTWLKIFLIGILS